MRWAQGTYFRRRGKTMWLIRERKRAMCHIVRTRKTLSITNSWWLTCKTCKLAKIHQCKEKDFVSIWMFQNNFVHIVFDGLEYYFPTFHDRIPNQSNAFLVLYFEPQVDVDWDIHTLRLCRISIGDDRERERERERVCVWVRELESWWGKKEGEKWDVSQKNKSKLLTAGCHRTYLPEHQSQ
jgi:hypothetical protein